MTYLYVDIDIRPFADDYVDILSSMLAEGGFDTFEPTDKGVKAYILKDVFDESWMKAALDSFFIEGVSFAYTIHEMEDKDYNEEWEKENFDPVLEREFGIRLDPRMAFGSGSHETTHQLVTLLMEKDFSGQHVLDMGCGTGVLGITMAKRGASHVTAIDIDNMSVDNTILNFSLNFEASDSMLTAICGDTAKIEGQFDSIVANIFKSILIRDLPVYVEHLNEGGTLVMSGFYTADAVDIIDAATSLGLSHVESREDNDWTVVVFNK